MVGRLLLTLAAACSALACILLGLDLIAVSIPIYGGMMFADYPDPSRPGHLKGVTVSGPELVFRIALVAILLVIAVRSFWLLAKIKGPAQTIKASTLQRLFRS